MDLNCSNFVQEQGGEWAKKKTVPFVQIIFQMSVFHIPCHQDHKEEVTCVSFNGGDSYIASGSTSGDIILHSITTNLSSKAFGHGPNEVLLSLFNKLLPYSYARSP